MALERPILSKWLRTPRAMGILFGLLGFLSRLPHLGWGLPDVEEEAFPMKKAFEMWGWDTGALRLDPETAGWPSLTFYVHLALQRVHYGVGRMLGWFENRYDYYVAYELDPSQLTLLSRLLSVVVFAVMLYASVRLATRLAGWFGGLMVGLVLLLSPPLLSQSQMVSPDIYLTMFAALAVGRIVDIYQQGRARDYVWAGIWVGLGTASKYTPALLTVTIFLTHLMRRRAEARSLGALGLDDRRLLYAALACVLAFCATSPYILMDLDVLKRDVAYQSLHLSQGHFGHHAQGSGYWFYLQKGFWPALGPAGCLLGLTGLVAAAVRLRGVWLVILLCFLPFYGVLGALETLFPRYMMPAFLPASLGLGGLWVLSRDALAARSRGLRVVVAAVAIAALTVPLLRGTLAHHARLAEQSTQQQARQFILETMPRKDSYLAMEMYTPQLPMDVRGQLRISPIYPRLSEEQRDRLLDRPFYQFQYIPLYSTRVELSAFYYDLRHYLPYGAFVTSGAVRKRYEASPDEFPEQNQLYEDLETYGRLVRTFRPDGRSRGPMIQIYELPEEGKRRLLADRGRFEPGFYLPYASRLHAPHFLAFIEGVAAHALQQEQYETADLYYQTLLDNSPEEDRARVTEQVAFVKLKRSLWDEAEHLYRRVVTVKPRDPIAAGNYGLALENLGRISDARRYYERCIQLEGGNGEASRWARERLQGLEEK